MFSMASRQDLANWVELGNEGWGFDDLMSYYRKSETYHPASSPCAAKLNDSYLDTSVRSGSGPIQVGQLL
jgi:choline dehydrogenase